MLVFLFLSIGSIGAIYETWARKSAKENYPPPGKLISMPWGASHLHCLGIREEGKPTLLLQSGLDIYGSLSWAPIHEKLSRSRRVCAYDRAGMLWSEPNNVVRDGVAISAELNSLLEAAGETSPYLVIGHSRGGLLSIIYAGLYAEQVRGLVLIDSSHFDHRVRAQGGSSFTSRHALPSWAVSSIAHSGWLRAFDPYPYGDLPRNVGPAKQFMPISIEGFFAEWLATDLMFDQASKADLMPLLPVLVLSREVDADVSLAKAVSKDAKSLWQKLQSELAALTDCGTLRVVNGSGHYVHHDKPTVVVDEIATFMKRIVEGHSCEPN